MQTKPKSNSVITSRVTDGGTLLITVLGVGDVEFQPTLVNPALRARAEMHGWNQRLVDAAAMSKDTKTGKPASAQDKFDRIKALKDHYHSGTDQWGMRSTTERKDSLDETLVAALGLVYPEKTEEALREWLAGKSRTAKVQLLAVPKVAEAIATMREGSEDEDLFAGL